MSARTVTYKLRNWRRLNQLSQADAAEKMQVARRTWHQWERGTVVPGPEHMVKLVRLCGGSIEPNDFYDVPLRDKARQKDAA